ncbi:hypothetical protein SCLCIDRAFT_1216419 [Scleroderma citrinum Foug A]|uniref:Uncharacterized protein n=1 Tax=Scleroderma citrinum Foug A TaxID=1036808 RepID=A0A0C3DYD8_9AGAM|nr:hypothetical protein SCLCIDRAFT_1216419 [Scleroderma citrinum Foug A]
MYAAIPLDVKWNPPTRAYYVILTLFNHASCFTFSSFHFPAELRILAAATSRSH